MSQHEGCFDELLRRIQEGQPGAAEEFIARYGPHVLRTVRRALHRRLRSKFDSEDFVQAVWASFFADLRQSENGFQLYDVVAYLKAMARNKTISEFRRRRARKPFVRRREVPWIDLRKDIDSSVPPHGPTPSALAVAQEIWNDLTDGRSADSVEIFEMRRRGISRVEIARRLGINERTIRRFLDQAQRRLKRRT